MVKIIAIFNQIAELGKTTTVVNLGHALALEGKKVTLLDLAPQGDMALALGLDNKRSGMDEVLLNDVPLDDVIILAKPNLRIVPAGRHLANYEKVTDGGRARGYKLKTAIKASSLMHDDFVLIDCASSAAGLLSFNVLFAAHHVLLPISNKFESLEGVIKAMNMIQRVEKLSEHKSKLWLLFLRMTGSDDVSNEVRRRVMALFPQRSFNTVVGEYDDIAMSRRNGQTIFEHSLGSQGAEDYRALAQDILKGRII